MNNSRAITLRRNVLQSKLNELLQPSAERESIKVENFADPLDQLSSTAIRELAIHLVDRSSRLISEIRIALTRIDEGTYGLCESCDDLITSKRLDAVPWARLCVSCQTRQEGEHIDSAGHLVEAA
jgi:DnaK suppressor protein